MRIHSIGIKIKLLYLIFIHNHPMGYLLEIGFQYITL